ncbi:MAG TPA: phage tail length tape measure family protein, partial [Candidatus Omnitrophota bacterium]|nr:phage tail length tape measure family protein [Candidatus Omnitrophota bacterium]
MTLQVAVQITGDAASLKGEAASSAAAIKTVGATATAAGAAVKQFGTDGQAAIRVVGAAADAAAEAAQRLAAEQANAARIKDAYGLSSIRNAAQLKEEADAAAQAAAVQAAAAQRQAAAVQAFRDRLNPVAKVQREAAQATSELQGWLAKGAITQDEYAAGVEAVELGLRKMGKEAGVSAGQIQMARRTVIMNLADMGQVAAATGGNMGSMVAVLPDLFYGLRMMGGGAATAATGMAALAGTVGLAAAAYYLHKDSVKELGLALQASNDNVGLSRDQLEGLAKSITGLGNVSVMEARELEGALARVGSVGNDNYKRLVTGAADYAALVGGDLVDANVALTKALGEPAKAAAALDAQMNILTAEELRHIQALDRAGEKEEAQALLLEAIEQKAAGAAKEVGFFTRAINGISDAVDAAGKALGPSGLDQLLQDARDKAAAARRGDFSWSKGRFLTARDAEIADSDVRFYEERQRLEREAPAQQAETARRETAIKRGYEVADAITPGLSQR